MVDETMLMAVKQKQEKQALQVQVCGNAAFVPTYFVSVSLSFAAGRLLVGR